MTRRRQPNIVLIMSDQHRADVMGCAGDPVVHTPRLDGLAAEGVLFDHAYCQGPLCMPARASLLTERYVRDHGVSENSWDTPTHLPTFVADVATAGYHTSCIGKMHLWVHGRRGGARPTRDVRDRITQMCEYGFAEPLETVGKLATAHITSEYTDYLGQRGRYDAYREWIASRRYAGQPAPGTPLRVPIWTTGPNPVTDEDYIDTWHGRRAAQWIAEYNLPNPFFLWVGFPGPHDPWDAPASYTDRYRNVDMPTPRSLRLPDVPDDPQARQLFDFIVNVHSDASNLTDDAIAAVRRAYYGNVTLIDDAVGTILDALETRGMLEDTWVIYTSDHGEMLGEHRLLTKMVFYDPAITVPLVIRPPGGRAARVVTDLIEHLDLAATIRAIAGSAGDPSFAGHSLLDWCEGRDGWARPVVYSENFGLGMIRTPQHKLIFAEDTAQAVQYFDLSSDPDEDNNLANDPVARTDIDSLTETFIRPFLARGRTRLGLGALDRLDADPSVGPRRGTSAG
jgi:choline-sulfatase